MEINLTLNIDQINMIMTALGEMPVKSGAGQLVGVIISQVQPQLPKEEPAEETTAE